MKKEPGIFNDVFGPVMRGPSSSHTAASWRIARISVDILNDQLEKALIEFDRFGAWANNYKEQGTNMGIEGGLLHLDMTDERMKETENYAREKGVEIKYLVSSFPTNHPNTVRLTLWGTSKKEVQVVAISIGGGSFEIQSVNGFNVPYSGDLFAMICFSNKENRSKALEGIAPQNVKVVTELQEEATMYFVTSPYPFDEEMKSALQQHLESDELAFIDPVMPVISGRQTEMPFSSFHSLVEYAEKTGANLGELGLMYEQCLGGLSEQEVTQKMDSIARIIHQSIQKGLDGTEYEDRILPQQSHLIQKAEKAGKFKNSVFSQIVANVTAIMESKSGMEPIVAAPTAGSCGTFGGTLKAVSNELGSSHDELLHAYFAAGLVGVYFAKGPGFSAEEHGCQVECGAAAGMAAAAIVQLMGGSARQALGAASMAIQNMIGVICDPVADRVEVPCLGKNVSAAANAYTSAMMAISGYDAVIPLDQVLQTVSSVGRQMPSCLKCTGEGGLAATDSSKQLKKALEERLRTQ